MNPLRGFEIRNDLLFIIINSLREFGAGMILHGYWQLLCEDLNRRPEQDVQSFILPDAVEHFDWLFIKTS